MTATADQANSIGLDGLTAVAAALAEAFALGGEVVPGDPWPTGDGVTTLRATVSGAVTGAIYLAVGNDVVERLAADPQLLQTGFQQALDAATASVGVGPATIDGIAPSTEQPPAAVGIQDGGEVQALVGVAFAGVAGDHPGGPVAGSAPDATRFDPAPLHGGGHAVGTPSPSPLSLLQDVEMDVTVELGRTTMPIRELLGLQPGMVIEIDRAAGAPIDVLVNGRLIACGEVVVIDEEFGIRITEIIDTGTRF